MFRRRSDSCDAITTNRNTLNVTVAMTGIRSTVAKVAWYCIRKIIGMSSSGSAYQALRHSQLSRRVPK